MKLTKDKCMQLMGMIVVLDIDEIIDYKERDDLLHRVQLKLDAKLGEDVSCVTDDVNVSNSEVRDPKHRGNKNA